ncbi:MAG: hypothetical protein HGA49_08280 [Eubacteriaceae bacterium]|nr:hypothetical protein [Eubacteriaceae bacterium]
MSKKALYDSRVKLFSDVMSNKIPERVPLWPFVETWVFHYANISVKDAFLKDNNLLFNAYKKFYDDIPVDALASFSNTVPFKMSENFGEGGIYTVNDQGVQIIGSHGKMMDGEELPELAKDVKAFFANVIAPRKFPKLDQSLEKNVDLIKRSLADLKAWGEYNGEVVQRWANDGMPLMIKATNYNPMDVVLDYLRDFVGISSDIRRRPTDLFAACEVIYDYVIELFLDMGTPADNKFLFSPLHVPTFMRPKDFEKLYFPFMKKYIEDFAVTRGYNLHFFMENDWMPYLDILQDLPETSKVVGLFELGDLKAIKEKMKGRMVFQGGLSANALKYYTLDQVRDNIKKTFDDLAPGGGFIYGTDFSLMNLNDGKPENLIEAFTFAKEYGKY